MRTAQLMNHQVVVDPVMRISGSRRGWVWVSMRAIGHGHHSAVQGSKRGVKLDSTSRAQNDHQDGSMYGPRKLV